AWRAERIEVNALPVVDRAAYLEARVAAALAALGRPGKVVPPDGVLAARARGEAASRLREGATGGGARRLGTAARVGGLGRRSGPHVAAVTGTTTVRAELEGAFYGAAPPAGGPPTGDGGVHITGGPPTGDGARDRGDLREPQGGGQQAGDGEGDDRERPWG